MANKNELEKDIDHILAHFAGYNDENSQEPVETLHVYPVEGGILILREEDEQVIDSLPLTNKQPDEPKQSSIKTFPGETYVFVLYLLILCFFICLDTLSFSLLSIGSLTATITITPKEKNLSVATTILAVSQNPRMGQIQARTLPTLSLTESKTAKTTGKGHQDATFATGTITFYNGLLTSQTIAAGTILIGSDGVQVITNQAAFIPAAEPPIEGHVTILAHALKTGSQGNIQAQDINEPCCVTSVLAINPTVFQGGQSARDYTYVTQNDLQILTARVQDAVSQNVQAALQSQLLVGEALITPNCSPTVSADHKVGEERRAVTVTISENCNALTYNRHALEVTTTNLLSSHAAKKLGVAYNLFGSLQTNVLRIAITDQRRGIATIKVTIAGSWVYRLTLSDEARILQSIAGKCQQQATRILLANPGVNALHISGIDKNGTLPTDTNHIHLLLLTGGV